MILKGKDIALIVAVCAAFTAASLAARRLFPGVHAILIAAMVLGILLAAVLALYRQIHGSLRWHHENPTQNYRQIESLFSLFSVLQIDRPLPAMRGSAISPDFANTLVSLIRSERPARIVELGSGVSTLIAGYSVRQIRHGRVVSVEQDGDYAAESRRRLREHGLGEVVTLIHAPLKEIDLRGHRMPWYDVDALAGIDGIDLLVVDGPLQQKQRTSMIRYPALPILIDRLSENAIILVDDCHRDDERQVVRRWREEHPELGMEQLPGEKRHVVLRRYRHR